MDLPLTLHVTQRSMLARDILGLTCTAEALPDWTPGAHVTLETPGGALRPYSLCGAPGEAWQFGIKLEPAGRCGSAAMHGLAVGDSLRASAPRNDFPLTTPGTSHLFIAGGIGITPIMAMLRAIEAEGGKPWKLIYLTRDAAGTAFLDELAPQRGRVTIHHDGGDPDRAFDLWPLLEQPKGRHIHCCGPRGLMQAVRDMTGHWPASAVHFEDFSAGQSTARADDAPFTARLARSGRDVPVPAGTTLMAALDAAGIVLPRSCEAGSCGSCRTTLLAGAAEHRDLVLMAHEQASQIMPCVSRAAPGCDMLVLDL